MDADSNRVTPSGAVQRALARARHPFLHTAPASPTASIANTYAVAMSVLRAGHATAAPDGRPRAGLLQVARSGE